MTAGFITLGILVGVSIGLNIVILCKLNKKAEPTDGAEILKLMERIDVIITDVRSTV